jgi:hypothetical protein
MPLVPTALLLAVAAADRLILLLGLAAGAVAAGAAGAAVAALLLAHPARLLASMLLLGAMLVWARRSGHRRPSGRCVRQPPADHLVALARLVDATRRSPVGPCCRAVRRPPMLGAAVVRSHGAPGGPERRHRPERKAGIVAAALFLLSPAQFPWYAAWMMPFLAFNPMISLLALSALLPIYYSSFHFLAREQYDVFRYGIVWLIWLPAWAGLAIELWRRQAKARLGGVADA